MAKIGALKLSVDTTELDAALAKAKELEAILIRIATRRPLPYTPYTPWQPYVNGPYWTTTTSGAVTGVTFNDVVDDK